MDLGGLIIGWREVLVGLIVLLALYMFVVVWRMRRLQRKSAAGPAQKPEPQEPAAAPRDEPGTTPASPASPTPAEEEAAWRATQARLVEETLIRGLRDEMEQVRTEVDALRGEVAALRDELSQQLGQIKATQMVSPLYNDAMQMAQIGHDASIISERCGISRAEAELVVALVKSQNS